MDLTGRPRLALLLAAGLALVCVGACGTDSGPDRPTSSGEDSRLEVSEPRSATDVADPEDGTRDRFPRARRAREAHLELRPFAPTGVELDGVAVDGAAPVQRVVTGADGSLGLPEDPGRLGWWSGGAMAAAPYGSVVVAGHLDSRTRGLGFAARLSSLRREDTVVLTAPGKTRRYVVRSVYLLPRVRLDELARLLSVRGEPRLVLLTCGGDYDHEAGAYSDNLVVEATPVPG